MAKTCNKEPDLSLEAAFGFHSIRSVPPRFRWPLRHGGCGTGSLGFTAPLLGGANGTGNRIESPWCDMSRHRWAWDTGQPPSSCTHISHIYSSLLLPSAIIHICPSAFCVSSPPGRTT